MEDTNNNATGVFASSFRNVLSMGRRVAHAFNPFASLGATVGDYDHVVPEPEYEEYNIDSDVHSVLSGTSSYTSSSYVASATASVYASDDVEPGDRRTNAGPVASSSTSASPYAAFTTTTRAASSSSAPSSHTRRRSGAGNVSDASHSHSSSSSSASPSSRSFRSQSHSPSPSHSVSSGRTRMRQRRADTPYPYPSPRARGSSYASGDGASSDDDESLSSSSSSRALGSGSVSQSQSPSPSPSQSQYQPQSQSQYQFQPQSQSSYEELEETETEEEEEDTDKENAPPGLLFAPAQPWGLAGVRARARRARNARLRRESKRQSALAHLQDDDDDDDDEDREEEEERAQMDIDLDLDLDDDDDEGRQREASPALSWRGLSCGYQGITRLEYEYEQRERERLERHAEEFLAGLLGPSGGGGVAVKHEEAEVDVRVKKEEAEEEVKLHFDDDFYDDDGGERGEGEREGEGQRGQMEEDDDDDHDESRLLPVSDIPVFASLPPPPPMHGREIPPQLVRAVAPSMPAQPVLAPSSASHKLPTSNTTIVERHLPFVPHLPPLAFSSPERIEPGTESALPESLRGYVLTAPASPSSSSLNASPSRSGVPADLWALAYAPVHPPQRRGGSVPWIEDGVGPVRARGSEGRKGRGRGRASPYASPSENKRARGGVRSRAPSPPSPFVPGSSAAASPVPGASGVAGSQSVAQIEARGVIPAAVLQTETEGGQTGEEEGKRVRRSARLRERSRRTVESPEKGKEVARGKGKGRA